MNEILIGNVSHLGSSETFDRRILAGVLEAAPRRWMWSAQYKTSNVLLLQTSAPATRNTFYMSAVFQWLTESSLTPRSQERTWFLYTEFQDL